MSHAPHVGQRIALILSLAAALSLLSACDSTASLSSVSSPSPIGFWGSEATDQPNLSFDAHAVSGTDGCNRLSGSWHQDETGRIHFENITSTEMACDWVNDWLANLDTAIINDGQMRIYDMDGHEIGRFERN